MLKRPPRHKSWRGKRETCEKGATCKPSKVCWAEIVFAQPAREKNIAGYCEALPILVQQRPCAYMRFTVGVHFS